MRRERSGILRCAQNDTKKLLQEGGDFGQRLVELGGVAATRLREVRAAAAGAADDRRDILDDVARFATRYFGIYDMDILVF